MSRHFPGTAEELDLDLLMIWQAMNDWEKIDGEWGNKIHHLKNDLRFRHIDRRKAEEISNRRDWTKVGDSWKVDGYPFEIRLFQFAELPWAIIGISEDSASSRIKSFDSMDEAKAFVEKRCDDIDRFEVGP